MIIPAITTHYSLLSGFIKPDEAAKKCKELGYTHCLLADDSLSGVVDFFLCMKKAGVVPIIGLRLDGGHYIAKTMKGYRTLIRLASGETAMYESSDLQFYSYSELDLLEVRYADQRDAILLKILLCSKYKTTLRKMEHVNFGEDKRLVCTDKHYFKSSDYHSENNLKLISELEEYDILSKPKLPRVDCGNMTEAEYLTELCREGWRKKFSKLKGELREEYGNRVKEELSIITGFNLSGYFLIVQDIINFVRKNGWLPGPGRGSAGGCLISYLLGITEIDPVKYGLLFSRFLNSGRFSDGNISLPDIDMDVPSIYRDEIISYIKSKYGDEKVYQMITFGRLQGRSAIKEVARVYGNLSFAELNEITESLPQEASISDELEEMDVKSVIIWTLENEPKKLERWCKLDKEGNLTGELSDLFDLAIRIEGTYKSQGKHPAGVVISNEDLINDAPLIRDRDGNKVVGLEMSDLDKVGLTKFDVLGINLLDKIMEICEDE